MTDTRVTVSVREILATEVQTWLRVGVGLQGTPILEQVQQIGTMPETVVKRFRLEEVQ